MPAGRAAIPTPIFDPAEYLDEMAELGLSDEQATEILGIENQTDWVDEKLRALDNTMGDILTSARDADVSPAVVAQDVVTRSMTPRAA